MMAEAENKEEFEGLRWSHDLEDDALAEAQARLQNEFDTDFEDKNYSQKGFAKSNHLPFYTGFEDSIEFMDNDVEISVDRSEEMNTVEFWVDDIEVMENMDEFFEEYTSSNGGEIAIEPYLYEDVQDTEVRDLLADFSTHFELEGPERRPGKGQARKYAIRRENLENDYLQMINEDAENDSSVDPDQRVIINGENDGSESSTNYTGQEAYIPGDAQFQVSDPDTEEEIDIEGEISIKPNKRTTGLYTVKLKSGDEGSLTYLINRAGRTLE